MTAAHSPDEPRRRVDFWIAVAAMAAIVLASNILVQHPVRWGGLSDWLTYGAFSYPLAFLVTDLTNRRLGAAGARKVVYVGFVLAVALSAYFATPRIALASGTAFLAAQLLDVAIFDRLRQKAWWLPPFASSVVSSALDTAIFFSFAFYCGPLFGTDISGLLGSVGIADSCIPLPWVNLAIADYGVKLALAAAAILPYGALLSVTRPGPALTPRA